MTCRGGRLGLRLLRSAFPRALPGAGGSRRSFLAIPSAFTKQTGEAHWHVLMRARAIENGCYVFAAAQGGKHENGRETFGHSLVVDPWGRIVAEGGTEPGVVMAEIDPAEVAAARARVPSLQHGRRFRADRAAGGADASSRRAESGMIHYSLICEKKHGFDIWFKNSADYDKQVKRGLVSCPACGSVKVEKALMAPSLGRGARKGAGARCRKLRRAPGLGHCVAAENKTPVAMVSPQEREFRAKLKELRDHLTKNADNVGAKFPEERARCITGKPSTARSSARPRRRRPRTAEEGVEVHPLPVLPDDATKSLHPDQQRDSRTINVMPSARACSSSA